MKRPKVSELLLQNLQPILFMAVWYRAGAEKVEVPTIYETYKLNVGQAGSALSDLSLGYHWKPTTVPNDQMSVAVFQGVSIITSGLLHIGAPTGVPSLAYLESAGYVPPRWPKLDIGEPYIVFTVVHEDIVRFDICTLRFSDTQEHVDVNLLPVWT